MIWHSLAHFTLLVSCLPNHAFESGATSLVESPSITFSILFPDHDPLPSEDSQAPEPFEEKDETETIEALAGSVIASISQANLDTVVQPVQHCHIGGTTSYLASFATPLAQLQRLRI